jgi:hypothetical protein
MLIDFLLARRRVQRLRTEAARVDAEFARLEREIERDLREIRTQKMRDRIAASKAILAESGS